MTSPVACLSPVRIALPFPKFSTWYNSSVYRCLFFRNIDTVLSVLLSSMIIISFFSDICTLFTLCSVLSIVFCSLYTGMIIDSFILVRLFSMLLCLLLFL